MESSSRIAGDEWSSSVHEYASATGSTHRAMISAVSCSSPTTLPSARLKDFHASCPEYSVVPRVDVHTVTVAPSRESSGMRSVSSSTVGKRHCVLPPSCRRLHARCASSHGAGPCKRELQRRDCLHVALQPSPSAVLPSSHCSAPCTEPFPHTTVSSVRNARTASEISALLRAPSPFTSKALS